MEVQRARLQVHIRENSLLARVASLLLGAAAGVALVWGSTIHVWGATREQLLQNHRWLRHELEHVQQYRRMGTIVFLMYYLWYSIRFGYRDNPLEIEARQKEKEPVDFDSFEFV